MKPLPQNILVHHFNIHFRLLISGIRRKPVIFTLEPPIIHYYRHQPILYPVLGFVKPLRIYLHSGLQNWVKIVPTLAEGIDDIEFISQASPIGSTLWKWFNYAQNRKAHTCKMHWPTSTPLCKGDQIFWSTTGNFMLRQLGYTLSMKVKSTNRHARTGKASSE